MELSGFMNERKIPTTGFLYGLRELVFSGCGLYMAMMLCLIGNIACQLSNIPHVTASTAEDTTFLVFDRQLV